MPSRWAAVRNDTVSESVTCWLYRKTFTFRPEKRLFSRDTYCGGGGHPRVTAGAEGGGGEVVGAGCLQHVVADRLGGGHRSPRVRRLELGDRLIPGLQ